MDTTNRTKSRHGVMAIAILLATATCASCSTPRYITREIPKVVEKVVRDTIRETKNIHTSDTIIIRDSIAPNTQGGIDRWHSESKRSKDKTHDTIYIFKEIDRPIAVEVEKEVPIEVEKRRSLWERAKEGLGWIAIGIGAFILAVGIKTRR